MVKGRDQLRNVLFEVFFSEVTVASRVVETDVDSGLEEVVLAHDGVEKGLHVNPTVLVPVKLEESRCAEEVSELERQL